MGRVTGTYRVTTVAGESVRAFVPLPLPPADPPLLVEGTLARLHEEAVSAVSRLEVASGLVPSTDWFLYGFVRKEAVVSSEIEGTQATLRDVATFEATNQAERPEDVEEVCNYVEALGWARKELARPRGLPLSTRLLCGAHKRLMKGVRGAEKLPGEVRRSQNWIGGTRPGNARFVPPPPEAVADAMGALEKYFHAEDPLPPLVRVGLAHVQFETIHPFLDGNGRIGRLLIALLLEHWKLMSAPLLYLSLPLRRRQGEYYARLAAVRTEGDWEGWTGFFLECVREAAEDGVRVGQSLFALLGRDREKVSGGEKATVPALRLLDLLPSHPVLTTARAVKLLKTTKPTAMKAMGVLAEAGVLYETTGKQRDRVFTYREYLRVLTGDEG